MLKSLFSGVSGLQSHQVAMDVESNNIANVNTIGFKYSRANFSDLLAQTNQIATAPQGQLGGKNAVQVGLGATVSSVTRIHSQGSIQNSDKNTDVAIQGDGFFIVSPDGGSTYKYSRSGDFKFDAIGNFVDNNGFIVQGWSRDADTGLVDATAPIANINIPPGLTTPAQASSIVNLKANLNSGTSVDTISPTYSINNLGQTVDSDGSVLAVQPPSEDIGVMFNEQGQALSLQQGQGIWAGFTPATSSSALAGIPGPPAVGTVFTTTFTLDDGTTTTASYTTVAADTDITILNNFAGQINQLVRQTGVTAIVNGNNIDLTNTNADENASHNINIAAQGATTAFGSNTTAYKYTYDAIAGTAVIGADKSFNTMEELRSALQAEARNFDGGGLPGNNDSISIEVTPEGRFLVTNPGGSTDPTDDYTVSMAITGFSDSLTTENERFTETMSSLSGTLPVGSAGSILSQSFNIATHSSSIDIYDSLGTKHTLRMEFRKTDVDLTTGTTWSMKLSVPEPATIDTQIPFNELDGAVRFNNDGSLATYTPISLSFTGNNGSAPNQQVRLDFGTANAFDGVTSFDSPSATSGISQDGFPGGDLLGIRIDQSGTLVGSFSNGRSFGLAQISMAKFSNNEGLVADGGNVYTQSANSGDPIIGTAATAGRGFIQSSALEASNVDLSRSLTQLIIIQRGYQANGKTITTSDQLLQTLIGLKN